MLYDKEILPNFEESLDFEKNHKTISKQIQMMQNIDI